MQNRRQITNRPKTKTKKKNTLENWKSASENTSARVSGNVKNKKNMEKWKIRFDCFGLSRLGQCLNYKWTKWASRPPTLRSIARSIDRHGNGNGRRGEAWRDALQIEQFSAHMVSYLTRPLYVCVCVWREI